MGDDQLQQYYQPKLDANPQEEAALDMEDGDIQEEVKEENIDNVEALPDSVSQVKPTAS